MSAPEAFAETPSLHWMSEHLTTLQSLSLTTEAHFFFLPLILCLAVLFYAIGFLCSLQFSPDNAFSRQALSYLLLVSITSCLESASSLLKSLILYWGWTLAAVLLENSLTLAKLSPCPLLPQAALPPLVTLDFFWCLS